MPELNPFKIAQSQLDTAAAKLGLDKATHELLRWPQRELQMHFPVRMDDGTVRVFHGYRVQYNTARGPAKGGLRWHPDETIDTVRALSAWMTWKTSVVDLPLGGGKGGVICNPKELSAARRSGWPGRTSAPWAGSSRPERRARPGVTPRRDHGLDDGRVRDDRGPHQPG
jgi:glutamate dehydrogenase (NAD(P)+)